MNKENVEMSLDNKPLKAFDKKHPTLMTFMFNGIERRLKTQYPNWGIDNNEYDDFMKNKSYEMAFLFYGLMNKEFLPNFKHKQLEGLFLLNKDLKSYLNQRNQVAVDCLTPQQEYEQFGNQFKQFSCYAVNNKEAFALSFYNQFERLIELANHKIETKNDAFQFVNHIFETWVKDKNMSDLIKNKDINTDMISGIFSYIGDLDRKLKAEPELGKRLSDVMKFFTCKGLDLSYGGFQVESSFYNIVWEDFINQNPSFDDGDIVKIKDYGKNWFHAKIIENIADVYHENKERDLLSIIKHINEYRIQRSLSHENVDEKLDKLKQYFHEDKKLEEMVYGDVLIEKVNEIADVLKEIKRYVQDYPYIKISNNEQTLFDEVKNEVKTTYPFLFEGHFADYVSDMDKREVMICSSELSGCDKGNVFIYRDNFKNKDNDDFFIDYVHYMNADLMTPIISGFDAIKEDYQLDACTKFPYYSISSSSDVYSPYDNRNHLKTSVGLLVKSHGLNVYRLTASVNVDVQDNVVNHGCFLTIRESCAHRELKEKNLNLSQMAYDKMGEFAQDNQMILIRDLSKMTEMGKKYLINKFENVRKNNPNVLCLEFDGSQKTNSIIKNLSVVNSANQKKKYASLNTKEEKQSFLFNAIRKHVEKREKELIKNQYDFHFCDYVKGKVSKGNKPNEEEYNKLIQVYDTGYQLFKGKFYNSLFAVDWSSLYEKQGEIGISRNDVKNIDKQIQTEIIETIKQNDKNHYQHKTNVKHKFK